MSVYNQLFNLLTISVADIPTISIIAQEKRLPFKIETFLEIACYS